MFCSLPVDIQCLILPLLHATELVSLSQTNRQLRHLIDPQQQHFIGRLLEIECLPEHGGLLVFDPQKTSSIAELSVPENRYACTQCLRLLPHSRFDNHSILGLRFRKPPPGSRAALQLCGWTSGDAKARGLKRQADMKLDTLENWTSQHPDWQESALLTLDEQNKPRIRLEELYKVGMRRNKRKCVTCKFASGVYSRQTSANSGTALVPVIKGRQHPFHDPSERFFPGLFPYDKEYPPKRKVDREQDMTVEYWTLYSIRCLGCGNWQEMANFRKGNRGGYKSTPGDPPYWRMPGWTGPKFEEWRCNKCIISSSGKDELSKLLLAYWKSIVDQEVKGLDYEIKQGWHYVASLGREKNRKNFWSQIVRGDNDDSGSTENVQSIDEIKELGSELRAKYYGIWKRHLKKMGRSVLGSLASNPWFRQWSDSYDIL